MENVGTTVSLRHTYPPPDYCDYCYNGGTCVGDYNCSCPAGYTGPSCDESELISIITMLYRPNECSVGVLGLEKPL